MPPGPVRSLLADSLLRPALIVVLVSCIGVALLTFLRHAVPEMAEGVPWTLALLVVLAGLVGVTTTTWLAHPNQRLWRTASYRLAELFLLLAGARVPVWLFGGALPSLRTLLEAPLDALWDGNFIVTALAVVFAWIAAVDFADDLSQLGLQADELWVGRQPHRGTADSSRPAATDRAAILRRFVARWVGWGIFLIVVAATLRLGFVREQFQTLLRQDVDPVAVGAIVVYFLVGLLLISLGQLAVLRARWTIGHTPSQPAIARTWALYTFTILLGFAIVAVFLPLGDTFLLAVVLQGTLTLLFGVIYPLFRLLAFLVVLLFSLLPGGQMALESAPSMAAAPPPAVMAPIFTLPPWVGGVLFWLGLALLVGYAAYFYFADKDRSLNWLRRFWLILVQRWALLWRAWRAWRPVAVRGGRAGDAGAELAVLPWYARLLPWRFLTPSQQVRYLYFALLDAAARLQAVRRAAETPHQYALRLQAQLVCGGGLGSPESPPRIARARIGRRHERREPRRGQRGSGGCHHGVDPCLREVRYAGADATSGDVRKLRGGGTICAGSSPGPPPTLGPTASRTMIRICPARIRRSATASTLSGRRKRAPQIAGGARDPEFRRGFRRKSSEIARLLRLDAPDRGCYNSLYGVYIRSIPQPSPRKRETCETGGNAQQHGVS